MLATGIGQWRASATTILTAAALLLFAVNAAAQIPAASDPVAADPAVSDASLSGAFERASELSASIPIRILTTTTAGTVSINALSPTSATAGGPAFTLTVGGSGFVSGARVFFGSTALSTAFSSASLLTASVTAALITTAGTVSIAVENPNGAASAGVSFSILPALSIGSLSPSSVAAGSGAFTLTVNGSGFVSGAQVKFGGTALSTAFASASQLTASVTAGLITSAGTVSVTVTNPGGATSPAATFTILSSVSISSLSPSSVTAGSGAFTLTVNGGGFVSGAHVNFGGTSLSTAFTSASQLTASVTAGLITSAGTVNVTVTDPSGATSPAATFTILSSTVGISSLSPASALVGSSGFTLTVNGSGFASGASVKFSGTALSTAFVSATQLNASVTAGLLTTAGTVSVDVTNPNGATSPPATFTITSRSVSIGSLSPNSAPVGGSAFTLTVNGSGFVSGAGVQFGSASLATSFVSASQLNASVTAALITSAGPVSVTVTNPNGATSLPATFTIAAPLTITSSASLGEIALGSAVAATLTAKGGKLPYTWSSPLRPAGVTLNASSGALGGNPSQPGNYTFNAQVSDSQTPPATAALTLTLKVLGFTTPAVLPSGTTTSAYSQTLGAIGGTSPYTFSSSNLPAGLSITGAVLTGTPKTVGSYSFAIKVSDATGFSTSSLFSLVVTGASSTLSVTPGALPGGTVGTLYSEALTASGGAPPYRWAIIGGGIPPGLSLNAPSGVISGAPAAPGTFYFTAQATDSSGASKSALFQIAIAPQPLGIFGLPFPNGIVNSPYPLQILTGEGGSPPYQFSVSGGSPPPGLSLNGVQLGGVPTTSGTFSFSVTITDSELPPVSIVTPVQIVIAPSGNANLILSAASLSFNLTAGATGLPTPYSVFVQSSSVQQLLNYSVAVTPVVPWLDVTPGGTTPGAIGVALDPSAETLAASSAPLTTGITVTCLAPSPCAGQAQTIGVSLSVTAPPPLLAFTGGLVQFSTMTSVSTPLSQQVGIENIGGGSALISSASAADSWLTVTGVPASVTAGSPATITLTANPAGLGPGFYRTTVTVVSTGGTITDAVTLEIAQAPTLTLSQVGAQFQSTLGSAPGNTSGSFQVGVTGGAAVSFAAVVEPGAPWLLLNSGSTSGTASPNSQATVSYSIDPVAAAALTPAQGYYGTIQITASGVTNSPQNFEVVLNVSPATNLPAPDPEPVGLVFIQTANVAVRPPAQTVTVYSSSTNGTPYAASASTVSGGSWLTVSPTTGMTFTSSPAASTVSVDPSALGPGVYTGTVNYQSSATAVRGVSVTLIVEPPAGAPATSTRPAGPSGPETSPSGPCTPAQLVLTPTGIGGVPNSFEQPTGWPSPLFVTLNDNCGAFVGSGQVQVNFSNNDPPLVLKLVNAATGLYSGTWYPSNTGGQVVITGTATAPGYTAAPATTLLGGQVFPNTPPQINTNGTVHVFNPLAGASLGQGTIVEIFGTGLGASPAIPGSSPLPTGSGLNGTAVKIGGIPAALYYVSPTQIDAQLPYEIQPGSNPTVVVNANNMLSAGATIHVVAATPGIAAYYTGLIVAQHSSDNTLVSETSPAAPGEYLVIYLSGLGVTSSTPGDGVATPSAPLTSPTVAPTLLLNGTSIPIYFSGLSPYYVGLYQMNFQVPPDTPNGDAQLVVSQDGNASNPTFLPVHN